MAYTWEEVMLGIDVKAERQAEEKQQQEIWEKQQEESTMASLWSTGLSVAGGFLLGPAGVFLGKQLGKYGTDLGWFEQFDKGDYSDWEDMTVDPGKFNKETARQFNKQIAQAAKDQTTAQVIGTFVDLGAAYISSGGGLEGDWDPTTFGGGGAAGGEWSFLGSGTAPVDTSSMTGPELDQYWMNLYESGTDISGFDPITGIMPGSEDYIPGFLSDWKDDGNLLSNISSATGKMKGAIAPSNIGSELKLLLGNSSNGS